jgi:arabinofuranosyltransferase
MVVHRLDIVCLLLAALGISALYLGWEWTLAGSWGFALDDTWIHMQFARNIATRGEFAFNAGEPIAASTAPLWTLLLAMVYATCQEVVWATKAIGVVLLWATGILTLLLARELNLGRGLSLLAGLIVILTPRLVWGSLSGMEVMLYTALSTAGIWLHIRSLSTAPSKIGTLCFGLASLARPECVLLFPVAILDRWLADRDAVKLIRTYAWHGGLFALILLPSVVFCLVTLGKPLPNTFYAKVGPYGLLGALANGDLSRIVKVLLYYPLVQAQEMAQFGIENQLFVACLIPFGLLWFCADSASRRSLFIFVFLLSFPLLRGVLAPFQGPLFQHGRYAAHLIPLMTVTGLAGLVWLRTIGRFSRRAEKVMWIFPPLVLGSLAMANLREAPIYGQDVENIEHMHVKMGRWLDKNTARDAVLAAHDIGAIAYFSNRKVLDTVGLVTPAVLPYLRRASSADLGVLAYLRDAKPDYVILLPNWYAGLAAREDMLTPIFDLRLGKVTIAAGPQMVVYRPRWEN